MFASTNKFSKEIAPPQPGIFNRKRSTIITILFFNILYLMLIFPSCKKDFSSLDYVQTTTFPPTGDDTTSHAFTWQMDTISYPTVFQIIPEVIWGSDTNDVWMAGHSDWWKARIWHWDGIKWTPHERAGLGVSVQDMIGFSSDDIWLCGRRIGDALPIRTIQHWDGIRWNIVNHNYEQHIRAIWGTSSNNLFFGFIDGKIAHYDGTSFTTYDTGTKAQILDIYGLDSKHVFATGIGHGLNNSADTTYYYIFRFDGNNWKVNNYYWRTVGDPDPDFPFNKLWSDKFYLYGISAYGLYNSSDFKIWNRISNVTNDPTAIHGNKYNNLFIAGYGGESVYHYNGKSWQNFPELNELDFWTWSMFCFKDHVFIGGITNDHNAYILRGRRVLKGGD